MDLQLIPTASELEQLEDIKRRSFDEGRIRYGHHLLLVWERQGGSESRASRQEWSRCLREANPLRPL